MQPHPSLERIEKLYMCYQNELQTIMPNFSQELDNILKLVTKKRNYKNNSTPHFSEEFSKPMKIVSSPQKTEVFDIINQSIQPKKDETNNSKMNICDDCCEYHIQESRYCEECNETHSGCCDIILS